MCVENTAGEASGASSSSSSLSSASLASPADEGDQGDKLIHEDLIIYNVATDKYHLDAENGRLVDGKPFPLQFNRTRAVPPGGRLCGKCF